jgi:hypothetical protein
MHAGSIARGIAVINTDATFLRAQIERVILG